MLRIVVADAHEVTRRGVRSLIDSHPDWELAGEACDGAEALALTLRERPNVAAIAVSLPVINGLVLARRLREVAPGTNVLFLTMHDDRETIAAGLAAGARGYFLKTDPCEDLERGIAAVGSGRVLFSPFVADLLLDARLNGGGPKRLGSFTTRELEVAQLIAEGHGNKHTARLLNISVKTVESHRAAAMRKAGARTAVGLVRFAVRQHLIPA
jgi:DNA-binding NarL/FixJ family response regulator